MRERSGGQDVTEIPSLFASGHIRPPADLVDDATMATVLHQA
jgi:hypothetical protein